MSVVSSWRRLLKRRDFASLYEAIDGVSEADLAASWKDLGPLEKLAIHKLLPEGRTLKVFGLLDYEERYFLYCGADRMAVAPLLEGVPEPKAALIREFTPAERLGMLEGLKP